MCNSNKNKYHTLFNKGNSINIDLKDTYLRTFRILVVPD